MCNPLVSWLMPVYNSEKTLSRAMESMLKQTYTNFEVVVIYDDCTDNSVGLLEEYSKSDNRIRVYRNEYSDGVAGALNFGLQKCKGKYIARMDADDYSYPTRLEKQVAFMEEHVDTDIIGSYARKVFEDRDLCIIEKCPILNDEIKCHLLFNIQAIHPTVMFRTETLRKLKIEYPNQPAEDYALFASLINKANFANINEVLLDYHVKSDEQLTTVIHERIRKENMIISQKAISETLKIDTSVYPDSFFGARSGDNAPYDIVEYLDLAKRFLLEMINANKRYKVFNDYIFMNYMNAEYSSICSVAHVNSFSGIALEYIISELRKKGEDSSYHLNGNIAYPRGKVIIYGTGDFALNYVPLLFNISDCEIVAFCDSNVKKRGSNFLGKEIISPKELCDYSFDYIFIAAPAYYEEIRNSLIYDYKIPLSMIVDIRLVLDIRFIKKRCDYNIEFAHNGNEKKIFLFCAPDYANLGDHAIAYAEKVFMEEHFSETICEIPTREYRDVAEIAKHHIKKDDLILITGGGFLGSLWMNSENMVRSIVKEYPENNIIVLPQTLFWEDKPIFDKEMKYTRSIYQRHKKLTLFARDEVSYSLMKRYYPDNIVILAPDMVLSVDWKQIIKSYAKRKGALICLKTDKESVIDVQKKNEIERVVSNHYDVICHHNNLYEYTRLEKQNRGKVLSDHLNRFRTAEICITDRLHGMIFSVITGTPCVVLDNCNHKLRASYKWFDSIPGVTFLTNIYDLNDKVEELKRTGSYEFDFSNFKHNYEVVVDTIRKVLSDE